MTKSKNSDTIQALSLAAGTIDDSVIQQLQTVHSDEEIWPLLRDCLWYNSRAQLSSTLRERILSLGPTLGKDDFYLSLLQAQEVAKSVASQSINIYVAAMPKSGSSFLASALSSALDIPSRHLTTSHPNPSAVEMNGREQEIDELALVKRVLDGTGLVAQHHTKSTAYMMQLLSSYNVGSIVTFRNIFDAIISYDEMLKTGSWSHPSNQGALKIPVNYSELSFDERIEVISSNYAIWCIDFYLSWKRVEQAGFKFLWVDYDQYLSRSSGDKSKLCELLIPFLKPNPAQEKKIYDVIVGEDIAVSSSRLRKGVSGEGLDKVPLEIKRRLINYAEKYNKELELSDMKVIFGNHYEDIP